VSRLIDQMRSTNDRGIGVVLVEQKVKRAIDMVDRSYVLRLGQVVLEGSGSELRKDPR